MLPILRRRRTSVGERARRKVLDAYAFVWLGVCLVRVWGGKPPFRSRARVVARGRRSPRRVLRVVR